MSQIPDSSPEVADIGKFVTTGSWPVILNCIKTFSFGESHSIFVKKAMERAYNDGTFLDCWNEFQRNEIGLTGKLRRSLECKFRSTYNVIEQFLDKMQDEDYCDETVLIDDANQSLVGDRDNELHNDNVNVKPKSQNLIVPCPVIIQNCNKTIEPVINASAKELKHDNNIQTIHITTPKVNMEGHASTIWQEQLKSPSKVNSNVALPQQANVKSGKRIARKKIDFAFKNKNKKYECNSHVKGIDSNIQMLASNSTASIAMVDSSDDEAKYFVDIAPWKKLKIDAPPSVAAVSSIIAPSSTAVLPLISQNADSLTVQKAKKKLFKKNVVSNISSTSTEIDSLPNVPLTTTKYNAISKYVTKKSKKPIKKYDGPEITLTMTQILPGAQKLKRNKKYPKAHKAQGKKLRSAFPQSN